MKGDRVEVVVDAGDTTSTYEIVATRAGRRVDTTIRRGVVEVAEITRGGTTVRTARFMANRVLALVEHPAPRPVQPDDEHSAGAGAVRSPGKSPSVATTPHPPGLRYVRGREST